VRVRVRAGDIRRPRVPCLARIENIGKFMTIVHKSCILIDVNWKYYH